MKPRTGDGPLEVTKEGRGIVMRVPLEGGGRLVVELTADEAARLGEALKSVVGLLEGSLDRSEQPIAEWEQHRDEALVLAHGAGQIRISRAGQCVVQGQCIVEDGDPARA
jgi:hypothetical protein